MSFKNVIYRNLAAELARKCLKMNAISDTLNLSYVATSQKMRGITQFTIKEAFEIRDKLFPVLTIDYLFDTKPRYDNIDLFNFPRPMDKEKKSNENDTDPNDCA